MGQQSSSRSPPPLPEKYSPLPTPRPDPRQMTPMCLGDGFQLAEPSMVNEDKLPNDVQWLDDEAITLFYKALEHASGSEGSDGSSLKYYTDEFPTLNRKPTSHKSKNVDSPLPGPYPGTGPRGPGPPSWLSSNDF